MKTVCWNVRGLNCPTKRLFLANWVREQKPDLLALCETKMEVISLVVVSSIWQGADYFFKPAVNHAGGILILGKQSLNLSQLDVGLFSLSVAFNLQAVDRRVVVSVVYGPNLAAMRPAFWDDLDRVVVSSADCHLLMGDFNCLLSIHDSNNLVIPNPSMRGFQDFVHRHFLYPIPLTGERFSWSNMRSRPCCRVLDRVFVTPNLLDLIPDVKCVLFAPSISDHGQIITHWGDDFQPTRSFAFEEWWLQEPDFLSVITNSWNKTVDEHWAALRVQNKLSRLAKDIKAWLHSRKVEKFQQMAAWDQEISAVVSVYVFS